MISKAWVTSVVTPWSKFFCRRVFSFTNTLTSFVNSTISPLFSSRLILPAKFSVY
uniref:Uncharacterized protein n=1 Tax=Arundo donax TaxID=35708 RepID=A0A0A9C3X9_ARUDO